MLDTGVRAPLREGMENTAWPFAPGEESMVPKVVKTSDPDAAEWGKEAYGLAGEVRGNMRGGSVPRSKSRGLGVDGLWG